MKNIITFILFLFTSCVSHTQVIKEIEKDPSVVIDSSNTNITIYYPLYDSIKLECFTKITPETENAIFCCTAAFTADWDTTANHYRICGEHSSNGVVYNNTSLKRNTGLFIYTDGCFRFFYRPEIGKEEVLFHLYESTLDKGCGFTQEMMIHKHRIVKTTRPLDNYNQFRALCKYNGTLCIVDSKYNIAFGDFIQELYNIGVEEAIYMDMGGWNYSWYREFDDPKYIHPVYNKSITNLLVFYK